MFSARRSTRASWTIFSTGFGAKEDWSRLILRRIPASVPMAQYRGALSQMSSARTHPRLTRPMLDRCRGKIETRHYRGDRRWFDRVRPLRYERVAGAALTLPLLEKFMALHVREWRGQNAQSQFERPEERAYLIALARRAECDGGNAPRRIVVGQ